MDTSSWDHPPRPAGPSEGDPDRDPVEALADEFIARRRRGESPGLEEYAARCPERAEEIRELFPAIVAMERWKPGRPASARPRLGPGGVPIREQIGDFRLIREVGRGGMGVVFEAEQISLGRRVALKVMPGSGWADDRPAERFLREAKTAAGLRHPNIVPVFAVGREDDLHYYAMALVRGVGLDQIIRELKERRLASLDASSPGDPDLAGVARTLLDRSQPPTHPSPAIDPGPAPGPGPSADPSPRTARIDGPGADRWRGIADVGRQVAEALQHAHEGGIWHRDIKPANLLLDADGVAWVTDFGLAKGVGHDDLSRTGDLVGTLRYMAPERFQGDCDARSDVYSLGLTLYELIALRPAHDAVDRVEMLRKIAEAGPDRPRDLDPSIPRDLETVVLKAIEPDPARRYATAGEFAEDLARFAAGRPILARRASAPERLARWVGHNRWLTVLLASLLVLTGSTAYFFRLYWLAPHPPGQFPPDQAGEFRPGPDFDPDEPGHPPRPPHPPGSPFFKEDRPRAKAPPGPPPPTGRPPRVPPKKGMWPPPE